MSLFFSYCFTQYCIVMDEIWRFFLKFSSSLFCLCGHPLKVHNFLLMVYASSRTLLGTICIVIVVASHFDPQPYRPGIGFHGRNTSIRNLSIYLPILFFTSLEDFRKNSGIPKGSRLAQGYSVRLRSERSRVGRSLWP